MNAAFDRLCREDREILLLKRFGFDSRQAGLLFGITASAARSRLAKAKITFKRYLEENEVNIDE